LIAENKDKILKAPKGDQNRHDYKSLSSNLIAVKGNILWHIKNFEKWAADGKPNSGFIFRTLDKTRIRKEPLGVALTIADWNFHFVLLFQPRLPAISAGNDVFLKLSELAAACQDLAIANISSFSNY
jgi:aldehyde dehydrogenase (NAD+)